MTDSRFDNRSQSDFEKHINFSTTVEAYFFQRWLNKCHDRDDVHILEWSDSGIDNDGKFIPTGTNTSGADFVVSIDYDSLYYEKLPLEFKWVPTAGKFTLKVNDLRAYIKEKAAILFVYNTNPNTLRKNKYESVGDYIYRLQRKEEDFKWGILTPANVLGLYNARKEQAVPISYMGDKMCIVLSSDHYDTWFQQENWNGERLV